MRKLGSALALAAGFTLAVSMPSFAVGVVGPATGASSDPYQGCTVGAGTGRNYTRSEVEPYGSVNPTNADKRDHTMRSDQPAHLALLPFATNQRGEVFGQVVLANNTRDQAHSRSEITRIWVRTG